MGTYLTEAQIEAIRAELSLVYSLPYASDLLGTAWEQILADAKGGYWTGKRDNRPEPDFVVGSGPHQTNYSVKTEGLRLTINRSSAHNFLGHYEDIIVARPKVDDILESDLPLKDIDVNYLGGKVLEYYNTNIVKRYKWDVISFLLRVGVKEFIYWEQQPPVMYHPDDYWWRDSIRATGTNRNISGYPKSIAQDLSKSPPATFKWTSGGKQFYILYQIPLDADVWTIEPIQLSRDEIRDALAQKLRQKQRIMKGPLHT